MRTTVVIILIGLVSCGGGPTSHEDAGDGDADVNRIDAEGEPELDSGADAEADSRADSGADADMGTPGLSCDDLEDICGPHGNENCCDAPLVSGGLFEMGRGDSGNDAFDDPYLAENEQPEHEMTIADFRLDLFEVTVGRFRRFVEVYPESIPSNGSGENPNVSGSGWQESWSSELPVDRGELIDNLKCDESYPTWTDDPGVHEAHPINCVSWYEAFAFCIWDGGRLPTEAEWEYAAAGGSEDRLYPWGSDAPHIGLATYICDADGDTGTCAFEDMFPVGRLPEGVGRWGHYDLAGNMWEWVLDWYDPSWYSGGGASCTSNCSNLVESTDRARRGGSWGDGAWNLRAVVRYGNLPTTHNNSIGFRCARSL